MKILILGGGGFVSGHTARMALARGHEVYTLTRGHSPVERGVHPLVCDRNDEQALARALEGAGTGFDAVIDCICYNDAQARADMAYLPRYTKRLVVVSTDSVYHPRFKRVPQDENGERYMEDDSYGANKRRMELAFMQGGDPSLRVTLFRPAHIFGPGSRLGCFPHHSRQADLLSHMRSDLPLSLPCGGRYMIQPIYVDDLARVMLDCIPVKACEGEIFCIGGPDVVENAEYYRIIGRIIGHEARIESAPCDGLEAQYPGHMCQRVYCLDKLRSTGVALPDTTLEEGLRRQVAWLDAQTDA